MEYDLSPGKKQVLDVFFSFLIKRGEAPEGALPVKLIDLRQTGVSAEFPAHPG